MGGYLVHDPAIIDFTEIRHIYSNGIAQPNIIITFLQPF